MTSKHTPANSPSSAWSKLTARMQDFLGFGAGHDEIWELYRLSRGSDSLRPALIRKLDAHARR